MKKDIFLQIDDDVIKKIEANRHIIDEKEKNISMNTNLGITTTKDVFIPVIHPDDDLFNRTVKEILIDKKISLKTLAFEKSQDEFNYKRSLRLNRTMSLQKFEKWMELLGVDWTLNIDYDFNSDN